MKKIAIVTAFRKFIPGYSLTGIVLDQIALLTRKGHEVAVLVTEDYKGETDGFPEGVELLKVVPKAELTDYQSKSTLSEEHRSVAERMKEMCLSTLSEYDIILTHDLVFTGWNLPYAEGIRLASSKMQEQRWLHWIHSIPSQFKDWWELRAYGPKHRLVYPNRTDLRRACEQFKTEIEFGRVIPHPKDLRSWCDFDELTCLFIDDFPAVMSADVVQVYPASTDRLEAKRLREVILTFAELKRFGWSVCLVVANQHATGRQRAEDLLRYRKIASRNGLSYDEVIFTSEWRDREFKTGMSKRFVRELFMCSNVFLFPTREETFGLVMPEAALSGGVLVVMNKSLPMMLEISGMNGDFIDFGSFCSPQESKSEEFLREVASQIIGRLTRNESIMLKTYVRQRYNWDNLYERFYRPIMAESADW